MRSRYQKKVHPIRKGGENEETKKGRKTKRKSNHDIGKDDVITSKGARSIANPKNNGLNFRVAFPTRKKKLKWKHGERR